MAVSPATVPAKTNDRMTLGPVIGTASVSTMKMPVPIVAPMPNSDSWNSPIVRASSPSPVSAPVSSAIAATGLRRKSCSRSEALPPGTDAIAPPQSMSRASRSAQVSRRTTRRAVPFATNTTGIRRFPL
jgi:hypothetical protein